MALAAAFWQGGDAAAGVPEPIIVTSASKHFVVRGRAHRSPPGSTDARTIYVDPSVLAVTCERVREAVTREMKWDPRWRDTIFINVKPTLGRGEDASIQVIYEGTRGWRYRIDMPDEVTRRQLLLPIVEALLLEYANRGAREESVELPPWLATGLAEHLIHGDLAALALQPVTIAPGGIESFVPNSIVMRDRFSRDDPNPALRATLQEGALTVDQLSWPDHNVSDTKAEEIYRASAHLFVRELLRTEQGPEHLAATLAILPEHLNWQTAFIRAFEPRFNRMLDVEKWWSMAVVRTKTRESTIRWSPQESRERMEEILYTPMQVRLTPEDLPHVTPVSLSTLISEWSFAEQEPILREKLRQLFALRWRVPEQYGAVTEEYRAAIEGYLQARTSRRLAGKDNTARAVQEVLENTRKQFETIDLRRSELEKKTLTAALPATADE